MGNLEGDKISIIGSSHIKNNLLCQDSSDIFINDNYAIAIVCDGHGSKKHFRSDKGSLFATEVGISAISSFMKYQSSFNSDRNKLLNQLEKNIILNWNEKVKSHIEGLPFEEFELNNLSDTEKLSVTSFKESAYGSTFIAFVMTDTYCFGIQIGDGDCALLNRDGIITLPMPDDERLEFNVTTSLCDRKAIMNFRHFWLEEAPIGAILTSDGVRNSFSSEEYYLKFCMNIFESYGELGVDEARIDLVSFLPSLSENGSGDDLSVSVVYNTAYFNELYRTKCDLDSEDTVCKDVKDKDISLEMEDENE